METFANNTTFFTKCAHELFLSVNILVLQFLCLVRDVVFNWSQFFKSTHQVIHIDDEYLGFDQSLKSQAITLTVPSFA